MFYSKVIATGSYTPKKKVYNHHLETIIDTSSEWIYKRSGVLCRYIDCDNSLIDIAFNSAKKAIKKSNMTSNDIDCIIVATCMSEQSFPSIACIIQYKLEIPSCMAFDVQAACSGFICAISIADNFIKSGYKKKILLIGVDVMSKVIDWQDRNSCILFGDGAGSILLGADDYPGIFSTKLYGEGRYGNTLYLKNYKMKSDFYLRMNGKAVYKLAIDYLEKIILDTIKYNNINLLDIDWIIPHQANFRIINTVMKRLNFPLEKVVNIISHYGNTSNASIPIAFDMAIKNNKINIGDLILLESFGGGITCGSVLLKYV